MADNALDMTAHSMAVDLTNCDREPIHIPGAVQGHGLLLALDPATTSTAVGTATVRQWGGDPGLLAAGPDLNGLPLEALLGPALTDALAGRLRSGDIGPDPLHVGSLRPGGAAGDGLRLALDVTAQLVPSPAGPIPVLELEPAFGDGRQDVLGAAGAVGRVKAMLAGLADARSLDDHCRRAAEQVRRTTGYDRVMVYRFLPDGSGTVMAEAKAPDLESYLGLHYPASDIPRQARRLYLDNQLRLIADVDAVPRPLTPVLHPSTGQPLDLGRAALRAVSPVHLEYLRNMGVAATLTVSIICRGRLWGMLACHHRAPKYVPWDLRTVCELFARIFALQIDAREDADGFASRLRMAAVREDLVAKLADAPTLPEGLVHLRPNLLDLIPADGVAICTDGTCVTLGATPDAAAICGLVDWLNGQAEQAVFATDALSSMDLPAADRLARSCGLLAISISRAPRDWLLWFRREVVQTVTWAGDPRKPVEPDGDRLSPRKSFAAWQESVRGRSLPWTEAELETAAVLRNALLEVVLARLDRQNRERESALERQRLLMAELDHRVKNTLANIQALILQSRGSATTLEGFTQSLEDRIGAMARTHDLLSRGRWTGASLREIAEDELAPYRTRSGGNVAITGRDLRLHPTAALALGMALHELATNAAKHGALSVPGGRVRLSWKRIEGRPGGAVLALRWVERDGPPVRPPTYRGFGCTVIEQTLSHELGGTTHLGFNPAGIVCEIEIPMARTLGAPAGDAATGPGHKPTPPAPPAHTAQPVASRPPVRPRVLIVEDSLLVALDLDMVVRGLGWETLGPVSRLDAALELVGQVRPDAAVLDVNLAGEMVFPLAERLADLGVPFVFSTGYEPGLVLPDRFRSAAVVQKPFRMPELEARLKQLTTLDGAGAAGGDGR